VKFIDARGRLVDTDDPEWQAKQDADAVIRLTCDHDFAEWIENGVVLLRCKKCRHEEVER